MKKRLKLRIPQDLSEITLDQYQKWVEVATKEGNMGTYFLKQKTIEILCNVPLKFVATIAHKTVEDIFNQLSTVLAQESADFKHRFKIGEVEYGFMTDFENMTSGEYIDLTSSLNWVDMHKAMSVMFRPITQTVKDKYLIEEYDGFKNEHLMKNIPADLAVGSVFFFTDSMRVLENDLSHYLQEEVNRNPQWKTTLMESGAGSIASIPSLSMILRKSMMSHVLILEHS